MPGPTTCAHCGAPLDRDEPHGLCVACLLLAAMPPGEAETIARPTVGPEIGDMATVLRMTEPAVEPEPFETLHYFGDYELIREVARGGMGVVYEARQVSLGRSVALKMILAGQLATEADVARFHAEAEAAARLDHPGIVPIFEIGEHDGRHYFSMAFIEGRSLAQTIAGVPLPPRDAAAIVAEVAGAVQYAHENGIIHRDLKPQNVLIDVLGRARVTDFGLAKRLEGDSGLTATGQVMGTPGFMPPEQAQGRSDVGPPADIYSLGAVLYATLTGRPPFQAASAMDTLLQVLEREPVPPRQMNPAIPRELETICLKALEKDPSRRYETARGLAEDLGRWSRGEPIRARRASMAERAWKWGRRRPAAAVLIFVGLAAVALAAGLGVAARYNRRLSDSLKSEATARVEAQKQREDARRFWYAADVNLAQRYWLDARVDRARAILDRQRPGPGQADLREFSWWYLWNASHAEKTISNALAGNSLDALAFDRDGRRLLTGLPNTRGEKRNGLVVAFDPDGHAPATTLWQTNFLNAYCAAEIGGVWAGLAEDGLWIGGEGPPRKLAIGDEPVDLLALSRDGRLLAGLARDETGKTVWAVETASGRVRARFRTGISPSAAVFAPDGSWLALGGNLVSVDGDTTIITVGVSLIQVVPLDDPGKRWELGSRLNRLTCLAVSPDGSSLISGGSSADSPPAGVVEVWDVPKKAIRSQFAGSRHEVNCLAVSPDGRSLAVGGDDRLVRLLRLGREGSSWAERAGASLATFRGHLVPVTALAFSPDGRTLASGDLAGSVRTWDPSSNPEFRALEEQPYAIQDVAFSPDGKTVVSADYRNVLVFDAGTGRKAAGFEIDHWSFAMALSPDGRTLATGGQTGTGGGPPALIRLWDVASGRAIGTLLPGEGAESVTELVFSPDGRFLATNPSRYDSDLGKTVSRVEVWDVARRRVAWALRDGASPLAFSPDGRTLAAEGGDRAIRFLDPATGRERPGTWPRIALASHLTFSADGRRIAARISTGGVSVWKTDQEGPEATIPEVHGPIAFSPDGLSLAACDGIDLVIHQVATGQELARLSGHIYPPDCLAFSPDGATLASGGGSRDENDGVHLWRAPRVEARR